MTIWDFASAHWFVALLMILLITAPIRLALRIAYVAIKLHFGSPVREDN